MATQLSTLISQELNIPINQVAGTVNLLDDGATIPFISRYRKEQTGNLDDFSIQSIDQRLRYYRELEKRRATILKTIEAQDKLTPELADRINNCWDANTLEDIYLPYKPKRKTRAEAARQLGLEPLAKSLWRSAAATSRSGLVSLLTATRCLTSMRPSRVPRTSSPSG